MEISGSLYIFGGFRSDRGSHWAERFEIASSTQSVVRPRCQESAEENPLISFIDWLVQHVQCVRKVADDRVCLFLQLPRGRYTIMSLPDLIYSTPQFLPVVDEHLAFAGCSDVISSGRDICIFPLSVQGSYQQLTFRL